jgi:hypothetical protein
MRRPHRRQPAGACLPHRQRWDVLAWNDAAATLFGDFGQLAPEDRSRLRLANQQISFCGWLPALVRKVYGMAVSGYGEP